MCVIGGFVQEQVLHDDALHRGKPGRDVMRIRVRLEDVFPLDIDALEAAIDGGVEHVGNAKTRFMVKLDAPKLPEHIARCIVGDMAIAGHLVREAAHVAGALHVVLAAQGVHADAVAAQIAGRHRKVRNGKHGGRPLAVLCYAKPVIDRAVAARRVKPCRHAQRFGGHGRHHFGRFRAVTRIGHERCPVLELRPVAAFAHERLVDQALGHDDMCHRGQHRDIGARPERKMRRRLDMRRTDDVGAARVDDDQLRALAEPPLHPAGEDRMAVGRIGTNEDDDVRCHDAVEILGARRCAESGLQTIAGRRVTNARAGIDIVVAEARADQFLDEEGFLIGAARRRDPADRSLAIFRPDSAEFGRGVRERLVPGHLAPRLVDRGADQGIEDALLVVGIAPGEAPLDAAMAAIGLAFLPWHHPDQFIAAHFRPERAADAAIGAGGDDRTIGCADLDDLVFLQGGGRTCLHAGAAGNAFGGQEILLLSRAHRRCKAASVNGQREGALGFVAGAHAARADDALGGIEGEIGVALVPGGVEVVLAFIAIAHVAQADRASLILQLAIAIGGAGEAIERVIGDVQLHHPPPQLLQPIGLGMDNHAGQDGCGAGRGIAVPPLDLDQAQPA